MEDTPSVMPSSTVAVASHSSLCFWFAACITGTTAVSLIAAHAPPRVRLIGLFSIAFGLVIGRMIVLLAEKLDADPSRSVLAVAAILLSMTGLIGATWESFRLEETRRPKTSKDAIAQLLIDQMRTDQTPTGAPKFETSQVIQFRRYLSGRLQQLGDWTSPWSEAFWIAELCAAAVASVWISAGSGATVWRSTAERKAAP